MTPEQRREFWKTQVDIYLVSSLKVGANGQVYSARMKSSWRPEWLRSGTRVGTSGWMVGMKAPTQTSRQERAEIRRIKKGQEK